MSRNLLRSVFTLIALGLGPRVVGAQVEPFAGPPPSPSYARFEFAILAGYRFESTLTFRDPTRYDRVEIDNAPTWGVTSAYNFHPNLGFELQYSYSAPAATAIALNPVIPDRAFSVGMHDFQVGLIICTGDIPDSFRPFLGLAIGATVLNSDQNLDEKVQLSLGVSAGVKAYFSEHIGVRAEVHYVPVFLYSTGTDPWFCYDSVCWDTGGRYLQQVDLRAGLTFRF